MSDENQELKVKMNDPRVKDVVHQYLITCDEQLDVEQCATDLQIDSKYIRKAIAILEGEGKIKVKAVEPPTEVAPLDTETKEPEVIEFMTLPKGETVQPSIASNAEAAPEETSQEQTQPPVEPTSLTPTEVVAAKPPTEAPEPEPSEALTKEEPTIKTPAEVFAEEVSAEAEPSEAPAEEPTPEKPEVSKTIPNRETHQIPQGESVSTTQSTS